MRRPSRRRRARQEDHYWNQHAQGRLPGRQLLPMLACATSSCAERAARRGHPRPGA